MTFDKVFYLDEVNSTNTYAKQMAAKGETGSFAVCAQKQTAGRGRLARVWSSPQGGLYVSMLLRPDIRPDQAPMLTLYTACGVYLALKQQYGLETDIKWPNDIYSGGKKLCGILTELTLKAGQKVDSVVIGIGLNLKKVDLYTAISLQELGINADSQDCLQAILKECGQVYEAFLQNRAEQYLELYKDRLITKNKYVKVSTPAAVIEGEALGIDTQGRLLVKTKDGIIPITAGDVTLKGNE